VYANTNVAKHQMVQNGNWRFMLNEAIVLNASLNIVVLSYVASLLIMLTCFDA